MQCTVTLGKSRNMCTAQGTPVARIGVSRCRWLGLYAAHDCRRDRYVPAVLIIFYAERVKLASHMHY